MTNPLAPLNRKRFFWYIVGWVLLQVAGSVLINFVTLPPAVTRGVNIAFVVFLAFLVTARLTDAGYRSWVGWAVVLGLLVALPLAMVVAAIASLPSSAVLDVLPFVIVGALVILLAFVVWVGARPSVAQPVDWSDQFADGDGAGQSRQRIEPRF